MLNQLFFQHSTRLNEQTAVNRLVRHAHPLVLGILTLQPPANLFRRPVLHEFTRNDLLQLHVQGKKAPLGPQGRLPGLLIGIRCSTPPAATLWLFHESTSRQQSLARCPLALPV